MNEARRRFKQPEQLKEQQLADTRRRLAAYLDAPGRSKRRRTGATLAVVLIAGLVAWRWWKATHVG